MKNDFILLVEDNPDDILLTQRALRKAKILNAVVVANDGISALEFLRCEGEYSDRDLNHQPIVILLDLKMPRMSGLEFLEILKSDEQLKLIPVVILTSSKEDQDVLNGYGLGANSYIQKPVDFNQFAKAIQTLGLYWLVLNVGPSRGKSG